MKGRFHLRNTVGWRMLIGAYTPVLDRSPSLRCDWNAKVG